VFSREKIDFKELQIWTLFTVQLLAISHGATKKIDRKRKKDYLGRKLKIGSNRIEPVSSENFENRQF
jgi:hypothetical protein